MIKHPSGRKHLSRKSQIEAFGLAMIVILITLGLFIVMVFRLGDAQNPTSPDKEYIYDELAVNFVNSIINVDVRECYDNRRTVSQLIRDCAKRSNTECSGMGACELVNQTISEILNRSLVYRNDAFVFYTDGLNWPNNGDELYFVNNRCSKNNSYESGQKGAFPVTLYPEPRVVYLYLKMCKQ